MTRVGIIMAGGTGSRLLPMTKTINKHLLPVYDKPMIYYPLTTLMMCGITEIAIIHNHKDREQFYTLLGNGERLGISISYWVQDMPIGIPDALNITSQFIRDRDVALILGDNIFIGNSLQNILCENSSIRENKIFLSAVPNPEQFGVALIKNGRELIDLVEKPANFISNWAVTGLYFFNNEVLHLKNKLQISNRNELEITDMLMMVMKKYGLAYHQFGRAVYWLDGGTPSSLLDASFLIKTLQENNMALIGSPEETAFAQGLISLEKLKIISKEIGICDYYQKLEHTISIKEKMDVTP